MPLVRKILELPNKMKRKLLIVLILLLGSLQFCLFADNRHLQQTAYTKQELNLFVASYVTKEDYVGSWISMAIESFEKQNPEIKINLYYLSGQEDQIAIKADTLFRSNKISMDVVVLSGNLIFYFAQQGKLLPVNELFAEMGFDKDDRAFINRTGEEKIYGISSLYEYAGLYYNEKLFKKANLPIPWEPKNWADIEQAIAELRKIPDIYPILMNIQKAEELTTFVTVLTLLYGTNDPFYKDGKWFLHSQGLYDSLKFIHECFNKDNLRTFYFCMDSSYQLLLKSKIVPEDKAGIILDRSDLIIFADKLDKNAGTNWKFVPMPTEFGQPPAFVSARRTIAAGIGSNTRNKKLSMELIKYLNEQDKIVSVANSTGLIPVNSNYLKNSQISDYMKYVASLRKYCLPRPSSMDYLRISKIIRTEIEILASGKVSPEESMKRIADIAALKIDPKNIVRLPVNFDSDTEENEQIKL